MAYNKTTWVDNSTPAVDAAHLNNIENGIVGLDVRLGTAESNIVSTNSVVGIHTTAIASNVSSIAALNTLLSTSIIMRTGTYSGTWAPTLDITYSISNYSDYNWVVMVSPTSYTMQNGHTINVDGYIDVDGKTIRFTASENSTSITARYTLIGIKKTISSLSTINH